MNDYKESGIWKTAFGEDTIDNKEERGTLRNLFIKLRGYAEKLASEISSDMSNYTIHDISHIDSLWEMMDLIIGENYKINPLETFVLGGAFLLHDLGMSIAAYPKGMEDIKKDILWKDIYSQIEKRYISNGLHKKNEDIENEATLEYLRKNHANQAEKLVTQSWHSQSKDIEIYLIDDVQYRQFFGRIIGKIAHSHWWSIDMVEEEFNTIIGAPPWCPKEWTIDTLKLACIIRVADASHIDSRRAPIFTRILRKIDGSSENHWIFQEKLSLPYISEDSLVYTSSSAFQVNESAAWWQCMEALKLIDQELRHVDRLLAEKSRVRFKANRVFGVESTDRLISCIPVQGWVPFDAKIAITDISSVVKSLGGVELYGNKPNVALRELIQNSSDAIRARRVIEMRDEIYGEINVEYFNQDGETYLEVSDNGIGMSLEVIKNYLLDFGKSYWDSELFIEEHPGACSMSINQAGKYGIGFFSIFMLSEKVKLTTRKMIAAQSDTIVIEFERGIQVRPLIRKAKKEEYLIDGGTIIRMAVDNQKFEEIWFNPFNKKTRNTMKDIVLSVAPALDISIRTKETGKEDYLLVANHWRNISNKEFVEYMKEINYIHGEEGEESDKKHLDSIHEAIEFIIDKDDNVLGRGSLGLSHFTGLDIGHLVVGGLQCNKLIGIFGIIRGKSERAARDSAEFDMDIDLLSKWASHQAEIVNKSFKYEDQIEIAQKCRILGANSGDLKICKICDDYYNYEELLSYLESRDELVITDIFIIKYSLKYAKTFVPVNNLIETEMSSMTPIISTPRYMDIRLGKYKSYILDCTVFGYIAEAIATAWDIKLNMATCDKFERDEEIVIGHLDQEVIKESAIIIRKSELKKLNEL